MGNEAVIRQTSEALVTLLRRASIGTRRARPVLNDELFIGIELPFTRGNFPVRLGYLPFDLDHLCIILDGYDADDAVSKRLVPQLDRALTEYVPTARYSGRKDGRVYDKPYAWHLHIIDLNRCLGAR